MSAGFKHIPSSARLIVIQKEDNLTVAGDQLRADAVFDTAHNFKQNGQYPTSFRDLAAHVATTNFP